MIRGSLFARTELLTSFALRPLTPSFVKSSLDPTALCLEDLFELLADVVHDRAEVVAVELLLPALAQSLREVAEAGHSTAGGQLGAPLEHVAHGGPEVALV